MNWSRLVRQVIETNLQRGEDLLNILADAAETDEERQTIEDVMDVDEALEGLPQTLVPLVRVEWRGGAYGSAVEIDLLDGGDCGLLLLRDDDSGDDLRVVASITSRPDAAAIADALRQVNPTLIVSPFASAPDAITNCRPEMLSVAAIRNWYCGVDSVRATAADFAGRYREDRS